MIFGLMLAYQAACLAAVGLGVWCGWRLLRAVTR